MLVIPEFLREKENLRKFLPVLIILIALPLIVLLSFQQQELRQRAATTPDCNYGLTCGACSATPNTCSYGNGTQSCTYTTTLDDVACNPVSFPQVFCHVNNCSSGSTCSNQQCVASNGSTPTPTPDNVPTPTPIPGGGSSGSNPLTDCSGYPEKRIFLETQEWWMDTNSVKTTKQIPVNGMGGHAHTATCFPQDQKIAGGTLHFNVRLMIHKGNQGHVEWLDIGVGPGGGSVARVNLNLTCPGSTDVGKMCEWWVPIDLDTSKIPAGYQELRFRFNIIQPNGERQFASTGWQAWFHGGTATYRNPPYLEARGWYEKTQYENAKITSPVPYSPVSGTYTFHAAMAPGSGGVATGDHGVHVDARFNLDDFGVKYVQGTGSFNGDVSIDTTQLTNGPHCVALRTSSIDVGGGTDTGILQFPIIVNNPGHPAGFGKGGCQPGT